MYTSLAIGATSIAVIMLSLWIIFLYGWATRHKAVKELGSFAQVFGYFACWTILTSPVCGFAVVLWQKALA